MSAQTVYTCDMCGKVAAQQNALGWYHAEAINTGLGLPLFNGHFCDSMCAIAALAGSASTELSADSLARILSTEIQQRRTARTAKGATNGR